MSGFYVGLPGLGSAYVEVRRHWLGLGMERHEQDAELWAGWLHVTLSSPRGDQGVFLPKRSIAACLGLSLLTFAGGVTASTMGDRLTSIFQRVEAGEGGKCLSHDSAKSVSQWSHFTACNLGAADAWTSRKVSGVTDEGHPIGFETNGETSVATVDRDIILTGSDGFQHIQVPGSDLYAVEAVYQDNQGRLVLKGKIAESDETVRIRFEKIEEIEIDDVRITLH